MNPRPVLHFPVRRLFFLLLMLTAALAAAQTQPAREPATATVEQVGWRGRLAQKKALAKAEKFDLILVGDSITHNLDNPKFQETVWKPFYAPRKALNLGMSGARTQNVLWTLDSGVLEGQAPKVVTLLIGTNNSDDFHYHSHYTAGEIAGGIVADVHKIREKLPQAKILLLRILPFGETPNARRATNDRASELAAARVVDWKQVFYADVNHVFLNLDRTVKKALMPDFLHPSPEGARLMAEALEPQLAELLGDAPRCAPSPNSAIVPKPKLENDFYDWWQRHRDVLAARSIDPRIVMIGDSITHMWGGPPKANIVHGAAAWEEAFGNLPALNMGFGWDRTQNVLWRLDHGELDGLHPQTAVLTIGVNNLHGTVHARTNTPEEVSAGILAIVGRIRSKSPQTRIIVMGVLPAGEFPGNPDRAKVKAINAAVAQRLGQAPDVTFLDIGERLLEPDGKISREIMGDFLHPTNKGYAIWAKALVEAGVRGGSGR